MNMWIFLKTINYITFSREMFFPLDTAADLLNYRQNGEDDFQYITNCIILIIKKEYSFKKMKNKRNLGRFPHLKPTCVNSRISYSPYLFTNTTCILKRKKQTGDSTCAIYFSSKSNLHCRRNSNWGNVYVSLFKIHEFDCPSFMIYSLPSGHQNLESYLDFLLRDV